MKKTKSKTLGIRVDRDVHEAMAKIKEQYKLSSNSAVIWKLIELVNKR